MMMVATCVIQSFLKEGVNILDTHFVRINPSPASTVSWFGLLGTLKLVYVTPAVQSLGCCTCTSGRPFPANGFFFRELNPTL